jgi:hypothetical protein
MTNTSANIVRGQSGNGTPGSFFAHIPGAPEIPDLSAPARATDFDVSAGPTSVIDTLLASQSDQCSQFWLDIAEDESTPPALLREMWRFAKPDLLAVIAENSALDRETRELASVHEDEWVRVGAAQWSEADAEFLHRFEDDDSFYVEEAVARNEGADPDQLRRLSTKSEHTWSDIANNRAAPADLIEDLYVKADPPVIRLILQRSDVTASQISRAVVDGRPYVRACVARSSQLTEEQQHTLSTDRSPVVRLGLASNRLVKKNMVLTARFAADDDERVRDMAKPDRW